MRNTMRSFMEAINLINENIQVMFGSNIEEPEISIGATTVEVKYQIHNCSDFNGITFTIEKDSVKVLYRVVAEGWKEELPNTFIGNCVKADIDKLLNVLNVEDETKADDNGFGL